MTKLSVNVNKVALLRNSRNLGIPSVIEAAKICLEAGAAGITVHPRPDQRHIRPSDVYELTELLAGIEAEFNIEGNPEPDYMELVRNVKPDQCTLVPDSPDQLTSDHGWNLIRDGEKLKPIIQELKNLGCRVSLFMETDPEQIERAKEAGADRIELYTEPYARAFEAGQVDQTFDQYARAAAKAQEVGLGVNAGHDLNLDNLGKFCTIPNILEVSIGHALIADALKMGLTNTVKAYLKILERSLGEKS